MIKKIMWAFIILVGYTYVVYNDSDRSLSVKTKAFVQNYYKNLKKMKIKIKVNGFDA